MVQDKNIFPAGYVLRLVAAVLVILASALILSPGQAYAHDGEDHGSEGETHQSTSSQVSGFIPDEYRFIVASGDNQTLLVRRSVQLYDMADDSIELTKAQAIYVETNVVRDMGARDLIYPRQILDVMSQLIASYTDSSQELGESALAAWQVYADQADFDISQISPQNVSVGDNGQVVDNHENEGEPVFNPGEAANTVSETEDSSWSVWLALAGTAAIVWYAWLRYRDTRSN